MKIKKIINALLITNLVSCSVLFTNKDISYLSNPNNYPQYNVKFHSIAGEHQDNYNVTLLLNVTFFTLEELNSFRSIPIENNINLDNYPIPLTILQKNSQILNSNNFYKDIKEGDILKINVSNYSTINSTFTFIAQIEFNNKKYLTLEDGINNIKSYLEEHRSPFFI